MILTNTDHLDGYKITEYLGLASIVKDPKDDLNEWTSYPKIPEGTDAIINIQVCFLPNTHSYREILLTGTAVRVEKV